jgi:transposase
MSEIPLNKYEKEERVIELHKEGKTIRAISPLVHMSFNLISKIIKAYDKKVQLDKKKRKQSTKNKTKKVPQ